MNILYLHCHDCGRAIQPYGWPVATPRLLRFAQEGILFRKAYSAAPTCGPSRTALLTGQYPHQCGMFGLPGRDGWHMADPQRHLACYLGNNGFETVLAGVQHEVNHSTPQLYPYQRVLDKDRPVQGEHYPETLDLVERYLQEPKEKPFFLSIGLDEPHRNNLARPEIGVGNESARFSKTRYYDPEKLDWRYTAPPPWLPDTPELRKDTESLHEGLRILDEYVGRVLEMLHHRGLADNTLVILTTDHGLEFPGAKKTLREQGTGVFLMLRGPGGFEGGRVIEAQVSHLDLYPTLLELLGLEGPGGLEGKSLLPLVRNQTDSLHEAIFTEQNYHGNLEALRAVNDGRYKLILRHNPIGPQMRQDGPAAAILESLGHYDRDIGPEELYDLSLDPMEACNRAHDPALAEIKQRLRAQLEAWMLATGDVFLSGNFPEKPAYRDGQR